ncbi:MAG TPA: SRPBCC family protein [Acidimicrobiia bacterium]|nr:SRPBCC family protein [Acidimicrobiia bacterium]
MEVDVTTEIVIERPRREVAAYVTDPGNAPEWYSRIRRVDRESPGLLEMGSRMGFVADFLGRELVYTYEVREFVPNERLVMSTSDGPFAMETTYTWGDTDRGGTIMALRNRGRPSGFSGITAPVMSMAMKRANRGDLRRLKAILERGAG